MSTDRSVIRIAIANIAINERIGFFSLDHATRLARLIHQKCAEGLAGVA